MNNYTPSEKLMIKSFEAEQELRTLKEKVNMTFDIKDRKRLANQVLVCRLKIKSIKKKLRNEHLS